MSLSLKAHVRLTNGVSDERDAHEIASSDSFSGLTLQSVQYHKLTDSLDDDAIVDLIYHSGGTQYHHWVYIYRLEGGQPKLMGFFHAGDRAYHGLYRVYGESGMLIVELLDPDLMQGDCCSTGFFRFQFHWNGTGFNPVGTIRKGTVDLNSN